MASRSRAVPGSGSDSARSSTCSMRAWQAATRALNSARPGRASRSDAWLTPDPPPLGFRPRLLERLRLRLAAAFEQDLDLLLRALERGLALPRERDAALEQLQRLIERQVAPLEAPDQGFELGQGLLEIGDFAVAGHRVGLRKIKGGVRCGAKARNVTQPWPARVNARLTRRQARHTVPRPAVRPSLSEEST